MEILAKPAGLPQVRSIPSEINPLLPSLALADLTLKVTHERALSMGAHPDLFLYGALPELKVPEKFGLLLISLCFMLQIQAFSALEFLADSLADWRTGEMFTTQAPSREGIIESQEWKGP